MDVCLITIVDSLEDFHDIIKAPPQSMEISMPGHPNCFIPIGISIMAMAMASFYTYRITQLDEEITSLKGKTNLHMDVSHLYNLESDHGIHPDPPHPKGCKCNCPQPIQFNFSNNVSITPEVGQSNLLAIGQFKIISNYLQL